MSEDEFNKDEIDDMIESEQFIDVGPGYFSSGSFSLTLKHIKWLKTLPNKSLLIRLLIEGAMLTDRCQIYIGAIENCENKAMDLIKEWRDAIFEYDKKRLMKEIRKEQAKRRRLIAELCKPPPPQDYEEVEK